MLDFKERCSLNIFLDIKQWIILQLWRGNNTALQWLVTHDFKKFIQNVHTKKKNLKKLMDEYLKYKNIDNLRLIPLPRLNICQVQKNPGFWFKMVARIAATAWCSQHSSGNFLFYSTFSAILIIAVYIPLQANVKLAPEELHSTINNQLNTQLDAAVIVAGDSNHTN